MLTNTQKDICKDAIITFGTQKQLDQAIEEFAELIQVINKCKRNGLIGPLCIIHPIDSPKGLETFHALAGEIADCEIMLEQIKMLLPPVGLEAIQITKERKLDRLQGRIEKYKELNQ